MHPSRGFILLVRDVGCNGRSDLSGAMCCLDAFAIVSLERTPAASIDDLQAPTFSALEALGLLAGVASDAG